LDVAFIELTDFTTALLASIVLLTLIEDILVSFFSVGKFREFSYDLIAHPIKDSKNSRKQT